MFIKRKKMMKAQEITKHWDSLKTEQNPRSASEQLPWQEVSPWPWFLPVIWSP